MPATDTEPPTWEDLTADPRYVNLTGGERMQMLDQWNADVQQHLGADYDAEAATSYLTRARQRIADEGQGAFSTAARSAVTGMNQVALGAVQGVGGLFQDASDAISKFSGVPGLGDAIIDPLPGAGVAKAAAPWAAGIAEEAERTYAPDAVLNPKSATVGGGVGQAVGMVPAVLAGPAGVLALGGAQGYSQGRDTATELGVDNPLGKMAMGAAFGATELLTERLGGIGAGPLKQTAKEVLDRIAGKGVQTIAAEAGEEAVTGAIQDTLSYAAGSQVEDPNRPGYTVTGQPLANYLPTDPAWWDRRGHEALGGAAGGAVAGSAQFLANRLSASANAGSTAAGEGSTPSAGAAPIVQPTTALPPGLEGASDDDFSAAEQQIATTPRVPREGNAFSRQQPQREDLDLSEAIDRVETHYSDPADADTWPADLSQEWDNDPLRMAVEDEGNFMMAVPHLPDALRNSPQVQAWTADWQRYNALVEQAKTEGLNDAEGEEYDALDESTNESIAWLESADVQSSLASRRGALEAAATERAEAARAQIEATGRYKWNRQSKAFDYIEDADLRVQFSRPSSNANDPRLSGDLQPGKLPRDVQRALPPDFTADEADQRVRQLERSLQRDGELPATGRLAVVAAADVGSSAGKPNVAEGPYAFARALAGVFGRRIVVVQGQGARLPFNGVTNPRIRDTIFLAADMPQPAHVITGHELLHHLQQFHGDLYTELEATLRPLLTRLDQARRNYAAYTDAAGSDPDVSVRAEIYADFMGDALHDPQFWQMLAQRQPGIFQRLATVVMDWFGKVLDALKVKGWASSQYFTDLVKARGYLADAVAEFARREQPGAQRGRGNPSQGLVQQNDNFMSGQQGLSDTTQPTRARPLREEFGGAGSDYAAFNHEDMEAWAAGATSNLSLETIANQVQSGRWTPVQAKYVLVQAMVRAEAEVRAATTQAEQMRNSALKNRIRALIDVGATAAGQDLAAQKLALAALRAEVPVMAVDDAIEKAQKQTIDAAVPVEPTVQGLDALTQKAGTEATSTLAGALGESGLGLDGTPQDLAQGEAVQAELQRLRQEVAAGKNLMSSATAIWQRVLETFKAAGSRKGALIKGLKERVAEIRAKRAGKNMFSGLQAQRPTLPATAVEDGFMALVETGLDIDAWKAAMTKTLGNQFGAQLDALYLESMKLFEQELKAVDAASLKTAQTKGSAAKSRERVTKAQSEATKAERVAGGLLDRIAETHSDPPIWRGRKAEHPVRALYREHLNQPMAQAEFQRRLQELKVSPEKAQVLAQAANLEINARAEVARAQEAMKLREELERLLKDSPVLARMINQLRSTISGGLNWQQIFTSTATAQRQWELDTYAAIRTSPQLQGLTPDEARTLTRELSKAWQRERRKIWRRELDKTLVKAGMAKPKHRAKIEASAPRLLSLINLGALDAATFRDAVAKEFGLKSMTDADVQKVKKLAEELQGTPPGVPYRQKAQRFVEGLQDLTKLGKLEIMESYWTSAVLSGWRTQVDIALGVLNGIEDVGFGGVVTALRTGKPDVAARAVFAALSRLPSAMSEAFHIAITGDRSLSRNYDAEVKAALEEGYTTMGAAGRALLQKGGWRTVPGAFMEAMARTMTALDHVTTASTLEGARWLAMANHPDLYRAALNITDKDRRAVREQARQVLTGGALPTTRAEQLAESQYARELLDARFSKPEIVAQAQDVALEAALQGEPTGLGMAFLEVMRMLSVTAPEAVLRKAEKQDWNKVVIAGLRRASTMSRVLLGTKFVRTAAQAMNRGVSYVPGIGAVQYALGTKWATPKGDVLMAKQMIGVVAGWAILQMFRARDEDDDLGIEGSWKNLTAQQRSQLYAQGKKPNHLWYRDRSGQVVSLNYQNWGLGTLFTILGAAEDARRYQGKDEDFDLFMNALASGLMAFTEKAQLQGLQTVFGMDNARSGQDSSEALAKRINRWAAMNVGGLVPRLIKDIDAVIDPKLRRTDHWWQMWAKELPIVRAQSSGARIDILGNEVVQDRGPLSRVYSSVLMPPEYRLLGALNARGIWITDPSLAVRKVELQDGTRRNMTDQERDRYERKAGQNTKEWLLQNGASLLKMDPEDAQDWVRKNTELHRRMAANEARR